MEKLNFCHICQLDVEVPCVGENYETCELFKSQVARGNAPSRPSSAVTAGIIKEAAKPLIYCQHCRTTVQTECTKEESKTCSIFKSVEARFGRNIELEVSQHDKLGEHPDLERSEIFVSNPDSGTKDDDGKVQLDLLAPEFLIGTAKILQFGATKYDAYNWARGMQWSRVFAALMRHMWKWWGGEKLDPESGMSHLWHASCGLMFLIAYEQRGTGEDDRWKS